MRMSSSTQVVTSSLYEDEQLHPSCDVISTVDTYVAGSNARVHINGLPCNQTTADYWEEPKSKKPLRLIIHDASWWIWTRWRPTWWIPNRLCVIDAPWQCKQVDVFYLCFLILLRWFYRIWSWLLKSLVPSSLNGIMLQDLVKPSAPNGTIIGFGRQKTQEEPVTLL